MLQIFSDDEKPIKLSLYSNCKNHNFETNYQFCNFLAPRQCIIIHKILCEKNWYCTWQLFLQNPKVLKNQTLPSSENCKAHGRKLISFASVPKIKVFAFQTLWNPYSIFLQRFEQCQTCRQYQNLVDSTKSYYFSFDFCYFKNDHFSGCFFLWF